MAGAVANTSVRGGKGLVIDEISSDQFRDFAKRHANSPEIGPIKTGVDDDADPAAGSRRYLFGLQGCGKLCAAVCVELYQSKLMQSAQTLKLDSVIVDQELRRRGLASLLVADVFANLLGCAELSIKRIYAHSVHPATVLLLRRLRFKDPPPTGAPISHLAIDEDASVNYASIFEGLERPRQAYLKLQCELCLKKRKQARPWCLPSRNKLVTRTSRNGPDPMK